MSLSQRGLGAVYEDFSDQFKTGENVGWERVRYNAPNDDAEFWVRLKVQGNS